MVFERGSHDVLLVFCHNNTRTTDGPFRQRPRRPKTAQRYETREKNNLTKLIAHLCLPNHCVQWENDESQKEREKHILPKSFYANVTNFLLWLISRRRNSVELGCFRGGSVRKHCTDRQRPLFSFSRCRSCR